ncbi:MAG: DUF2235 domain-containing protein [Pseudomonadota bacterium]
MAKKRIVVLCDGTWNDPEDDNPTNVLRMARAIKPMSSKKLKQVVFYDWGVGSYYEKVRGGVSGLGIMKNIQDGYRFIVQNYEPDDEIWLFGFSRGAYTVRCIAGMLNKCGILTRPNADQIPDAFDFYKKAKIKPGDQAATKWRAKRCYDGGRGPVKFIGVWDTVGALGVPTRVLAFMDEQDLFYDSELGSNVKSARHAVAIDERRGDFVPTLWGKKAATTIKQVWFVGVHSDVGGGYEPSKEGKLLSDIPLNWMAQEASEEGLEFESHLVVKSKLDYRASKHNSYKSYWKVFGRQKRELPKDAVMHESVFKRFKNTDYAPAQLRDWLEKRNGDWGKLAQ